MTNELKHLHDFYFGEKLDLVRREPHGRFRHPYLCPGGGYTGTNVDTHAPAPPGSEAARFGFLETGPDVQAGGPANWQGPIWLVMNYCLFRGLMRYGYRAEAERLFEDSVRLLHRDLRENGTTREYFDAETGAGMGASDFMNWNLTAFTMDRCLKDGHDPEDFGEDDRPDEPTRI